MTVSQILSPFGVQKSFSPSPIQRGRTSGASPGASPAVRADPKPPRGDLWPTRPESGKHGRVEGNRDRGGMRWDES